MSQRQPAQPREGARGPSKAGIRKMVMAMLDGATPLHFAAAAGGAEQVHHLFLLAEVGYQNYMSRIFMIYCSQWLRDFALSQVQGT